MLERLGTVPGVLMCQGLKVFHVGRSGNGGRGEVVPHGKGRKVDNFKYKPGGSLPKTLFLPAAPPAQGADGASVV